MNRILMTLLGLGLGSTACNRDFVPLGEGGDPNTIPQSAATSASRDSSNAGGSNSVAEKMDAGTAGSGGSIPPHEDGGSGSGGAAGEGGSVPPKSDAGTTGSGTAGSGGSIPPHEDGGSGSGGAELVVGSLVPIPLPDGGTMRIDRTEVTQEAYASWLATNPTTTGQPSICSSNDTFVPAASCMADQQWTDDSGNVHDDPCQGPNCATHPQVCVDWCDAYAYCKGVGKHLCGKVGGGEFTLHDDSLPSTELGGPNNAASNEWYNACSAGGIHKFVYGDGESSPGNVCNWYWDMSPVVGAYRTTVPVTYMASCQSSVPGYEGVYDLEGNADEWEDWCYSLAVDPGSPQIVCHHRGGSYALSEGQCKTTGMRAIMAASRDVGFRCCAD